MARTHYLRDDRVHYTWDTGNEPQFVVASGDTFRHGNRGADVRLAAIDAPEGPLDHQAAIPHSGASDPPLGLRPIVRHDRRERRPLRRFPGAVRSMIDHLIATYGLSREDAYVPCSIAADLTISEIVDGGDLVAHLVYGAGTAAGVWLLSSPAPNRASC